MPTTTLLFSNYRRRTWTYGASAVTEKARDVTLFHFRHICKTTTKATVSCIISVCMSIWNHSAITKQILWNFIMEIFNQTCSINSCFITTGQKQQILYEKTSCPYDIRTKNKAQQERPKHSQLTAHNPASHRCYLRVR